MKVLIKNFDDFSRTGSYCKLSQKNLKTNFYFVECRGENASRICHCTYVPILTVTQFCLNSMKFRFVFDLKQYTF